MKKAVILAAGRGTRMGDLTQDRPKPMIEINGKPMLEIILDRLRAAGFESVLLVTGYKRELIEQHFASYPMEIVYRVQQVPDGTGSATLLGREFVGGDSFLLTFGDILCEAEAYKGIRARLMEDEEAVAAVGVKWAEDPHQGAAVYETDGVVYKMIEKPPVGTSTTHWNSAGLYTFRASVFDELARIERSPRGEYELPSAVHNLIAQKRRLLLYAIEGAWRDVGRPEDLDAARKIIG